MKLGLCLCSPQSCESPGPAPFLKRMWLSGPGVDLRTFGRAGPGVESCIWGTGHRAPTVEGPVLKA